MIAAPQRSFFLFFFLLFLSARALALEESISPASVHQFGPIKTLILEGSLDLMGKQYGQILRPEFQQELAILENFYTVERGIPYRKLKEQADLLYQRFPVKYQAFLCGEAQGSGLNLDDIKILNAMETLRQLLSPDTARCAFVCIPPRKTTQNSVLIGRNYDYPPPFDQLASFLTVTILREKNTIPTAFISLAGEVYCPSCVNANGLFMELNNGTPSGGNVVDVHRQSLLANMLQILQNSANLHQLEKQLNAIKSDFSLIVNTADKTTIQSYEFSSTLGMKSLSPPATDVFVSTNFYLNNAWGPLPVPTDDTTWKGVTRRNNLLRLASRETSLNINRFEALMDKDIHNGGAAWNLTIYQFIWDTHDLALYVKINAQKNGWTKIPLGELFAHMATRGTS